MKRVRRIVVWLGAVAFWAFLLCLFVWFVVTEPIGGQLPVAAGPRPVDPTELEKTVRALVAVPSRSFGYLENLDQAAALIRGELARSHATLSEQVFEVQGDTYRNICATFGPDTPDRIVVGAHYDTADENPGADDNASGVAGLVALAGLLSHDRLRHKVELCAYSLEEPPAFDTNRMGSSAHAAQLRASGTKVIGMLSLEMIGYFRDEPGSQSFPLPFLGAFYPDRGDFIAVVSRTQDIRLVRRVKRAMRAASSLPVCSLNGPAAIPGVSFSDHLSYWAEGFPALMITDTAFYRNPHYHAATDLPMTLDYRRMAQVVAGIHAAVLNLDSP